jgi:hypothetical protein
VREGVHEAHASRIAKQFEDLGHGIDRGAAQET